jgi:hypothetical protein
MNNIEERYLNLINEWSKSDDEELIEISLLYEDEYGTKGFVVRKYEEDYKAISIKILRIFPLSGYLEVSVDLDVKYRLETIIKDRLTDKLLISKVKEFMEMTKLTYEIGAKIGIVE